MVRAPLKLALATLALLLPGCVENDEPAVLAQPEINYALGCLLLTETGLPLDEGSCIFQYGATSQAVHVDENGYASHAVPVGTDVLVLATAPGRFPDEQKTTVKEPDALRFWMTPLPEPVPEATLEASEEPAESAEILVEPSPHNATHYQPWIEEVFRTTYWMTMAPLPDGTTLPPLPEQNFTFDVTNDAYDALEVSFQYALVPGISAPAHAANITLN